MFKINKAITYLHAELYALLRKAGTVRAALKVISNRLNQQTT
jgi:hypothetical protein